MPFTTAITCAALGPAVHFGAPGGPDVRGVVVAGVAPLVAGGVKGVYGVYGVYAGGTPPVGSPAVGSPVVGTVGTTPGAYAEADAAALELPVGSGGELDGGAGGSPHAASAVITATNGSSRRAARRRTSRSTRSW
ncbi:hypothetical protein COUCH_01400 [Couchioplanes caeruleus]|uniref:hypothetical protein n=1 Tax=Couchioplanes caeruleus TaxID=56438 RepID=UPI0020BDFC64|nr:hypothetical protein [Couchioplanes caeruleus]UQU65044.1 hypothetical protein COUCH_01400 [Couchioplanes caeruleus]